MEWIEVLALHIIGALFDGTVIALTGREAVVDHVAAVIPRLRLRFSNHDVPDHQHACNEEKAR
jgi:hypothetical protein